MDPEFVSSGYIKQEENHDQLIKCATVSGFDEDVDKPVKTEYSLGTEVYSKPQEDTLTSTKQNQEHTRLNCASLDEEASVKAKIENVDIKSESTFTEEIYIKDEPAKVADSNKKKLLKCLFCRFRCTVKANLEEHLKTHTEEKPYSCKFCEFKSAWKCDIYRHVKVHSGKKPYECKVCDYKTTWKNSLSQHMKIHSGEKPYECKFCEYRASKRANLHRHMRTHSGEKPHESKIGEYLRFQAAQLRLHMGIHSGGTAFD